MNQKFKHFAVVLGAFGWALFFIHMIFFNQDTLETVRDSPAGNNLKRSIFIYIAPILFIWMGTNHWNKDRGTAKFSFLAFFLLFCGLAASGMGIDLLFDPTSGLKLPNFLLVIFGLTHILLAFWCYQNADEASPQTDKTPSLNFVQLHTLVKMVQSGQYSKLYSEEFGSEVSDATIQAVSEYQLKTVADKFSAAILSATGTKEDPNTQRLDEILLVIINSCWKELDEDSKYQFFPLISCQSEHTDFFFSRDKKLNERMLSIFQQMAPNHNVRDLSEEYYKNMPWAKEYPILIDKL